MVTRESHRMALRAEECLKKAIKEEFQQKALLGQNVVINRNSKACRIPAKEALKITKSG